MVCSKPVEAICFRLNRFTRSDRRINLKCARQKISFPPTAFRIHYPSAPISNTHKLRPSTALSRVQSPPNPLAPPSRTLQKSNLPSAQPLIRRPRQRSRPLCSRPTIRPAQCPSSPKSGIKPQRPLLRLARIPNTHKPPPSGNFPTRF
jgi:hypothetical protein